MYLYKDKIQMELCENGQINVYISEAESNDGSLVHLKITLKYFILQI